MISEIIRQIPDSAAYIDPSVTTLLIQAISGIAVAIAAFVIIYWRKAKKKVKNVLKIDDSTKKAQEDEIVEYDDKNDDKK